MKVPRTRLCLKKIFGVLDKWWSTREGCKWRFDCTSLNENLQFKSENCYSQMRNEDSTVEALVSGHLGNSKKWS